jgi:hypothetical protein
MLLRASRNACAVGSVHEKSVIGVVSGTMLFLIVITESSRAM